MNDADDFSGAAGEPGLPNQAFVNVDGVTTVIPIPNATASSGYRSGYASGSYIVGGLAHGLIARVRTSN